MRTKQTFTPSSSAHEHTATPFIFGMALVATIGSVALLFTPLSASQGNDAKPAIHPAQSSATTDSSRGFAVTGETDVSSLNSRPTAKVAPRQ